MLHLGLDSLRQKFLDFFEKKGHLKLESFPLVPEGDKSLLFINAGMTPLKKYFTGAKTPPSETIVTCQRCIRTVDIENVGKTSRHATFFEMLGNFSFGNYFKKEAIEYSWEFITKILKISKERLWVSVFEEDNEAMEIWKTVTDVKHEQIVRLGKNDNFWEIGTGPCGPCSEIYFDNGSGVGCRKPGCKPGCECDRFVEFLNLVFTQFDKSEDGKYTKLKKPNIDTGMGLERIAGILQGVNSIFEIDVNKKILDSAALLTKSVYGKTEKVDISLRIIVDHIKASVFLILDSVSPSNEGRGYVLRRLIRRAKKSAITIGVKNAFLYKLVKPVVKGYGSYYTELNEKERYIEKVIKTEEEKFSQTLEIGLGILNKNIKLLKENGKKEISGEIVFKLYDTYGFPFDLTQEILKESGIETDKKTFEKFMEKQKNMARSFANSNKDSLAYTSKNHFSNINQKTIFLGYDNFECESNVLYLFVGGEEVNFAKEGEKVSVVLDKTCFYAEGGGQVSDQGYIFSKDFKAKVLHVSKQNEVYILEAIIEFGELKTKSQVTSKIDCELRLQASRNHTSVHMLHAALKNKFGPQVMQYGSLVSCDKFRFDFLHSRQVSINELKEIESEVNKVILKNLKVETIESNIENAKKMGAIGIFEDKYKDIVRVVKIGKYSQEFCGGTHVKNTGQIGLVKIISECGVSSGVRRIEGICGPRVIDLIYEKIYALEKVSYVFKVNSTNLIKKAENIIQELHENKNEIKHLNEQILDNLFLKFSNKIEIVSEVSVIISELNYKYDIGFLRNLADKLKQVSEKTFVLISSKSEKGTSVVIAFSKGLMASGIDENKIFKSVVKILNGSGGGKNGFYQISIESENAKVKLAIQEAKKIIENFKFS